MAQSLDFLDLEVSFLYHIQATYNFGYSVHVSVLSLADRPVTYLYNTLHYYEGQLRDRTNLKRKLVHAIIGSLKDNRPLGWCLSDTYLKCAMNAREDNPWIPDDIYYCKLIARLVDNILLFQTKKCACVCACKVL